MNSPTVIVRVPASTSNCGPGFDTLGIAFDLYNEVCLSRREDGQVAYAGNHKRFQSRELDMIHEVADRFFERTGCDPFGYSFDIQGEVPFARGLGSSVTVRAGILGALNAVSGNLLDREAIVEIVSALEGHPDNAAAAVLGGFCVARIGETPAEYRGTIRFSVPDRIVFVVAIPDTEIETSVSRRALPDSIPFDQAVSSLNSLAYLVAAVAAGDFAKLQGAVRDRIHEPYRLPHIPGGVEAIRNGIREGAYAGWLSGSGSSVLCVADEEKSARVAPAMKNSFAERGIGCAIRILHADNRGMTVSMEGG